MRLLILVPLIIALSGCDRGEPILREVNDAASADAQQSPRL